MKRRFTNRGAGQLAPFTSLAIGPARALGAALPVS